jgi:DNA-binding transcriptional MerR regulator
VRNGTTRMYRAQEFADLAGVTVRTLHHYDRLGLLKPVRRTDAGYRLYCDGDLERLEQIVAFKFVGLPLKRIKTLLDRDALGLPQALAAQRRLLEEKRRLLDTAICALREAELAIKRGEQADSAVLKKIIEVIEMQNNQDWMMKYSDEETRAKIEARKHLWSPELQERVSRQWTDLFHDCEAALGEDPASEKVQALAARWMALVEEFTGGDSQITQSVENLYADRSNWPADFQQRMTPYSNPEVWSFMHKAIAVRKEKSTK